MAICCIGLGLILGSIFTENQVSGVGSAIIVFASLFSGAWMDLEMIGGLFQSIGNAFPLVHAVNAARDAISGSGFCEIAADFYWVLGYALVFFVLGIFCFRWKTKG
jgi:ABC-2 type transport system permease protein